MLKGVGFKYQVRVDCRKGKSQFAKLDWSRIAEKEILQNFKPGPSPRKRFGFHSNLSTYKRETLATFWKPLEDLCVYSLWDMRGVVPSNYTSIYRSKIYNQALVKPSCCYKDQQLKLIWNLWVRSQSHKCGCLCATNPRRERVHGFKAYTWSCQ